MTNKFSLKTELESKLPHIFSEGEQREIQLNRNNDEPIVISLDFDQNAMTAAAKFDLGQNLVDHLQQCLMEQSRINDIHWPELKVIYQVLSDAILSVLSGIKYYFNNNNVQDRLHGCDFIWWPDADTDVDIKPPMRLVPFPNEQISLKDDSLLQLQTFLDNEIETLEFGLKHLHRARNESRTAFQWIDATIAAELAIKQCLIFMEPKLESLLLEMPSPPLTKLYSVILESVTGKRSSKLSALRKGVETRNKLIHRPVDTEIDIEQVAQYLDDIEIAIYELMTFMYPDDPVFERICHCRMKARVEGNRTIFSVPASPV